ncbi:MAG: EAL domain-containing protein [Myxococcota bacterium]
MSFLVDSAWTLPPALSRRENRRSLDLFYVRIPFGAALEQRAGLDAHAALVECVARTLVGTLGISGREYGVRRWPADDFIAWRHRDEDKLGEEDLRALIIDAVQPLLDTPTDANEITVARVPLQLEHGHRAQTFARAVAAAQRAAADPKGYQLECSASLLDRALRDSAFVFHHQPIVDCRERTVIAYESLCRGTMEGMKFPDLIFGVAERMNRVWQVGRVLRSVIADELVDVGPTPYLHFINIHPADLDDPKFAEQALHGSLTPHAANVVFELTERAAIGDYRRIKSFFAKLRDCGYRLAIDDLGSGYAGLTALAELDPDFIKFDMGLIRDVHLHPVKQRLLQRMHEFADEIGAKAISEGVENEAERDALLDVGSTLMQGYFFARPARGFAAVDDERFTLAQREERDAI